MLQCREEVLFLTKQLVNVESIVNTEGEKVMAEAVYTIVSSMPYFKENPHLVRKQQTVDDERERYNVIALVKGTKSPSNKTVVLMGHMDTV